MHQETLIKVEKLSRIYRQGIGLASQKVVTKALDNISLEVKSGEILCIVGESGSGKSTLLRCIAALDEIDKGTVSYASREVSGLRRRALKEFRQDIQLVLQNPRTSFNPMLTVGTSVMENVSREEQTQGRRYEAVQALAQVGIHSSFFDRLPSELSGGELQRAAIARALCSKPKVILLDEPTSALDLSIRGQIVRLLLDLQTQRNFSLVISTHDLALAESIADRIVVLYFGQVVEVASAEAFFTTPLHPYSYGLLSSRRSRQAQGSGVLLDSSSPPEFGNQACRLISRCPFSEDACQNEQILLTYETDHYSRCWKSQDWKNKGNGDKP